MPPKRRRNRKKNKNRSAAVADEPVAKTVENNDPDTGNTENKPEVKKQEGFPAPTPKELRTARKKVRNEEELTEKERYWLYGSKKAVMSKEEKEKLIKEESEKNALSAFRAVNTNDPDSKDIKVREFSLNYYNKQLFKDADLLITYGNKYGLIGPNGHGKTTLLKHISNRFFTVPEHMVILYVEQEVEASEKTPLQIVVEADERRNELLKKIAELSAQVEDETTDPDALEDLHADLAEARRMFRNIGGHSAEAKAAKILNGLQFTDAMIKQQSKEFSGGWRMRISIARALFVEPDLLLLDEPTNHLDLNAVIWLEEYLRRWKKALLVVSHDRGFLNYVCDYIVALKRQKLLYFKGNYDNYERVWKQQQKTEAKQRKNVQKTEQKVKQTSNKKKKNEIRKKGAKNTQNVIRKDKDYVVNFYFPSPPPINGPIIQVKEVSFGYENGRHLFEDIELNIDLESRIAMVGPNGAGKSTLMNLILGELEPTEGEIYKNRKIRCVKFAQHFVDQMEMTNTPITHIHENHPDMKEGEIRRMLGRFGLTGQTHTQPLSLCSGGQKSRVILTDLALQEPHILFLDEPTNHLDIESVDALCQALNEFEGAVVFITHDQRLISQVANEIWIVGNNTVEVYDGDFEEYRQEIIDAMSDDIFKHSSDEEEALEK